MTIFDEPHRMTRRGLLAAGGALAAGGLLAGCGRASGRALGALTVSVPLLPDRLHTTRAVGPILGVVLLGLEPLMLLGPDGAVRPNLALSHEQPKPTRHVFRLRPGVRFWDGSPLTADDVVASFEAHFAKGSDSAAGSYWTTVARVRAERPDVVVVDLHRPQTDFVYTVARTGVFSAAYARRHGPRLGTPGVLNMGTGPYRFETMTPYSRVLMTRNERYWGGVPRAGRIDAQVLDKNGLLLGVQAGEIDVVFNVPNTHLASFSDLRDVTLTKVVDAAVYKFNFSAGKEPWNDPHLRRAFAHTVDRAAIARDVMHGAVPAAAPAPPANFSGTMPEAKVQAAYAELDRLLPAHDLARARRELAASSRPDGLDVTVLVLPSDPSLSSITQTVAQSAAKIGINVKVREADEGTYTNAVYLKHETEGLSIDNFGAGSPDVLNVPDLVFHSRNSRPDGFTNVADHRDAGIDALLDEGARLKAGDPARAQLSLEVLARGARELPYLPVAFPNLYLALKDQYRFTGFNAYWWMNRWPDQLHPAGA